MHPELFRLGPFAVKSYGLLLALSFLIGIVWSIKRAKKAGVDPKYILDLAIVIFISSIAGARLFYVIFHLYEFKDHWLDIISPIQSSGDLGIGGLSMLGGVVLAITSGILYLRLKKLNVWQVADIVAPSFPLGIFLTRIGCFLNGCCFGKPAPESGLGIVFPDSSPAGFIYPGIHIYPTQLFSSFKGLVILILLLFLERFKRFHGYSFWLMLGLFGIGRFLVDFYRYYEPSMVLITIGRVDLSVNQGVSVLIVFVSALTWNYLRTRAAQPQYDPVRTNRA